MIMKSDGRLPHEDVLTGIVVNDVAIAFPNVEPLGQFEVAAPLYIPRHHNGDGAIDKRETCLSMDKHQALRLFAVPIS